MTVVKQRDATGELNTIRRVTSCIPNLVQLNMIKAPQQCSQKSGLARRLH